ncbi:hypothetical protein [Streptomyces sp. NPDC005970]|uniref:hypothetical protein n=1 Tax=Streptomyces sp. NPDC005970 TaxID=3156723 RepID=UPI0033ED132E
MPDPLKAHLLVRIETKLDLVLRHQEDHEGRIRVLESHGTIDHDQRIASLEKWRHALPTAAILSLASVITAVITAVLK